jgi:ribosomal protein S18 acetylase RimI-like enzyme
MNLSIEFRKPEITSSFDWQLSQEVNVSIDDGTIIAKAEIEILTLNKHRDALASYKLLDDEGSTDWEIPLNIYFKGHNLTQNLCESLHTKADVKKAKIHIMLEAISVSPKYRQQGVGQFLLQEIAKHYEKAQSITVLSMPMQWFVDVENCEGEDNIHYYQSLDLTNETMNIDSLQQFFIKCGFMEINIDESLLVEPLKYQILIASPQTLLGAAVLE